MSIITLLAGVVGLGLLAVGVIGFVGASSADEETSELETERAAAEEELDTLVARQAELDARVEELDEKSSAVSDSITHQLRTSNAIVGQANEIIAIYNEAIELGDAGDLSGERALFEGEGGRALLEAAADLEAQREARAAFPDRVAALGEVIE